MGDSMIRKTIFWLHLGCGVTAGLVIALMSATGVLLTYERQILDWVEHARYAVPVTGEPRLPIVALVDAAEHASSGFEASAVTVEDDPAAPVAVGAGRRGVRYVDPYTAEVLGEGATGLRSFFSAVTGWHRWFNASGENRGPWRAITGASNLAFLFIVLSGIYLWLPKVFGWAFFKTRLWFNPQATSGKARDFNWHHVFGIWSAVPLAVVVATATVFSYPWASDLVYRVAGEEPPARRTSPPGAQAAAARPGGAAGVGLAGHAEPLRPSPALTLDALFEVAAAHEPDWRSISLQLPHNDAGHDATVRFTIDRGNGGQPQLRDTLVVDARSGAIAQWQPFASLSAGRRARSWVRYLHTGEALGITGQTVAGVVSLTSLIMVWTGFALAYRRLITPIFLRAKKRAR
jgi:uncharacterized iron-regulated membrane protein